MEKAKHEDRSVKPKRMSAGQSDMNRQFRSFQVFRKIRRGETEKKTHICVSQDVSNLNLVPCSCISYIGIDGKRAPRVTDECIRKLKLRAWADYLLGDHWMNNICHYLHFYFLSESESFVDEDDRDQGYNLKAAYETKFINIAT